MITIVMGGQLGSEGKGSVASVLAGRYKWDLVIRTGSPQAGHTFKRPDGSLVKMRQLPVSWCYSPAPLYVPAGAIISKEVLLDEARMLRREGFNSPICVSPNAAVISHDAVVREQSITTGTTGEGVGATRADKCLRKAVLVRDDPDFDPYGELGRLVSVDDPLIFPMLRSKDSNIFIEATQGFWLSLDSVGYPSVTSTNLTVYRILDDAEIPFGIHRIRPVLVVRTFPIRIAGNSGYLANETTWGKLREEYGSHIPDEQTTVTKKVRRVGLWNSHQVKGAVDAVNPVEIVLTFADYLFPDIKKTGVTSEIDSWLAGMESDIGRSFDYLGVGIGELMTRCGERVFTPTSAGNGDVVGSVITEISG